MAKRKAVSKTKTLDERKAEIENCLSFARGDKVNLAYAVYSAVKSAPPEQQPVLVHFVGEHWDYIESNQQVPLEPFISKNEKEELAEQYGESVDAMLDSLVKRNLPECEFYAGVWEIVNNSFLKDDKVRAFALYYILIDEKVPYFQVDAGLKMSNDDFKARMDELRQTRAKLRYLAFREFDQKTEQADLILREIKRHDETDQTVLLAYLLTALKHRGRQEPAGLVELLRSISR